MPNIELNISFTNKMTPSISPPLLSLFNVNRLSLINCMFYEENVYIVKG